MKKKLLAAIESYLRIMTHAHRGTSENVHSHKCLIETENIIYTPFKNRQLNARSSNTAIGVIYVSSLRILRFGNKCKMDSNTSILIPGHFQGELYLHP